MLEEGLAGCEKSVQGEGGRERVVEEKETDDGDDAEHHPNLRLQWTWTALRRQDG